MRKILPYHIGGLLWSLGYLIEKVHEYLQKGRNPHSIRMSLTPHMIYQMVPNAAEIITLIWRHTYGYRPWMQGLPRHGSSSSHSHSAATPRGERNYEADTWNTPYFQDSICRSPPCTLDTKEHRHVHECHAEAAHRYLFNSRLLSPWSTYNK